MDAPRMPMAMAQTKPSTTSRMAGAMPAHSNRAPSTSASNDMAIVVAMRVTTLNCTIPLDYECGQLVDLLERKGSRIANDIEPPKTIPTSTN